MAHIISKGSELVMNRQAKIFSKEMHIKENWHDKFTAEYFLYIKDRTITITPFMREVLLYFQEPRVVKEVISTILGPFAGENKEKLRESIVEFLKSMIKLSVLQDVQTQPISSPVLGSFEVGQQFKNYIIEERITKTNKVEIYKCHHINAPDQKLLLKLLTELKTKYQFLAEYQLLNKLGKHPNIRTAHVLDSTEEATYMVLTFIEGCKLSSLPEDTSLESKIKLCIQLLEGIRHIHKNGILHGDIHLANFMVTKELQLYIIDLGMSYLQDDNNEVIHGGVPRFLPPERVKEHRIKFSRQKGDIKSEIFQIGILIFYLFYRTYPFSGAIWKELSESICQQKAELQSHTPLGEKIPTKLTDLLKVALQKDPQDRYSSVDQMLNIFKNL